MIGITLWRAILLPSKGGTLYIHAFSNDSFTSLPLTFYGELVVQKWLACLTPFFKESERKSCGCQHRLFFSQVEYCDNLIFHRRAALDRLGQRLLDANRTRTNPAAPVKGPTPVVKRGKTPVLIAEDARALLKKPAARLFDGLTTRDSTVPNTVPNCTLMLLR
jgi:hypothetical protein